MWVLFPLFRVGEEGKKNFLASKNNIKKNIIDVFKMKNKEIPKLKFIVPINFFIESLHNEVEKLFEFSFR